MRAARIDALRVYRTEMLQQHDGRSRSDFERTTDVAARVTNRSSSVHFPSESSPGDTCGCRVPMSCVGEPVAAASLIDTSVAYDVSYFAA